MKNPQNTITHPMNIFYGYNQRYVCMYFHLMKSMVTKRNMVQYNEKE